MSEHDTGTSPAHCENCETALQGHYCHVCGQRAHNPLHHFSHAVEEVFESFWHLDGRIFSTMRDLLIPGRLAINYLAGHRMRYIPPLRLFLVLTLVTFFIAHFTFSFDKNSIQFDDMNNSTDSLRTAKTPAEVERARETLLKELRQNEVDANSPVASIAIDATRAAVERRAKIRLHELESAGNTNASTRPTPTANTATPPGDVSTSTPHDAEAGAPIKLTFGDADWDPARDKANIPWLPDFVNRWLTTEARRGSANFKRLRDDPAALTDAWLRAVPTTLFVLVPVFALLLKVFYFFARRGYLEHLVVALYSHAWLMLAMLILFLAQGASGASGATWVTVISSVVGALITLWIPIYLFIMQKRVYRQGWLLTIIKYFVLGFIYFILLSLAIGASLMIGLVKM